MPFLRRENLYGKEHAGNRGEGKVDTKISREEMDSLNRSR